MLFSPAAHRIAAAHNPYAAVCFALMAGAATASVAAPYVEFDFARTAECRDVTPSTESRSLISVRLVEVTVPVSVRFHGLTMGEVEELDMEIDGAAAGLRVHDFSPATQLTSDVAQHVETTTTTQRGRSLDATLGGQLPIPYGEAVAHLTPSINASVTGSETATEKTKRLPPKYAVVVSGTSSEGRGVFFKLKRWSQTSLEGVHPLTVAFAVPANWRGGEVQVTCSARGERKVLFVKQQATVGRAAGIVALHVTGEAQRHIVAKPVESAPKSVASESSAASWRRRPASLFAATAAEMLDIVDGPAATSERESDD